MTWKRIISSPVLLFGMLSAALVAAIGAFDAPVWLVVLTAVVVALSTALAAIARVTPNSDPRAKDGTPLVPKS